MKINFKKAAAWLSAVVILAVFALSGCTAETPDPVVSPSPKPTASQTDSPESSEPISENSSEASSDTSSQTTSNSEGSSEPEDSSNTEPASGSSGTADTPSSGSSEGHSTILPDISADDPDFALIFSENPLDIDYNAELDEATSTGKMVGIINKYIALWEAEVDSAYQTLMKKTSGEAKTAIREEQSKWVSGTGAAIESIQNGAAENGSARQLEISGQILAYYRARAATLYSQLFQIEPDFSFAYQGNS